MTLTGDELERDPSTARRRPYFVSCSGDDGGVPRCGQKSTAGHGAHRGVDFNRR
jgi:hypothetical protein